ncbi:helix-turn-helix domain-containing protein [Pedobacter sp. R20-19]|uniref:helix-turn-helix domain-containing protein n=1 Tax=Pedobacter sp. R20-19 TaxID=1270196 RepID=UPI0004930150|nr:helix-turn-helix transcriptional regulator [Pedobacter sp. R20-19]
MGKLTEIEQYVIDRVREKRIQAGLTQAVLSVAIDLNPKFVGNVERSKTDDKYNINHLKKIAEILGCSMREFFPE